MGLFFDADVRLYCRSSQTMSLVTELRKWPADKADEIPDAELSRVVKALRTLLGLSAKESVDLSKRATPAVIRERRTWYRNNYKRGAFCVLLDVCRSPAKTPSFNLAL